MLTIHTQLGHINISFNYFSFEWHLNKLNHQTNKYHHEPPLLHPLTVQLTLENALPVPTMSPPPTHSSSHTSLAFTGSVPANGVSQLWYQAERAAGLRLDFIIWLDKREVQPRLPTHWVAVDKLLSLVSHCMGTPESVGQSSILLMQTPRIRKT